MVRQTLKARVARIEGASRAELSPGRLPIVVADHTPDAVIERRRAEGIEVYRFTEFAAMCVDEPSDPYQQAADDASAGQITE
jgi:hypothetical protein